MRYDGFYARYGGLRLGLGLLLGEIEARTSDLKYSQNDLTTQVKTPASTPPPVGEIAAEMAGVIKIGHAYTKNELLNNIEHWSRQLLLT